MIEEKIVKKKIESLYKDAALDPGLVDRFKGIVLASKPIELVRLNPYDFARKNGLDEGQTVALFLAAVKAGLFNFEWNLVCPQCGSVAGHDSIADINYEDYYCFLCEIDVEIDLHKQVEIAFSIDNMFLSEDFNPFSSFDDYFVYHFTSSLKRTRKLEDFLKHSTKGFAVIKNDSAKGITIKNARPGDSYRILTFDTQKTLHVRFTDEETLQIPQVIDTDLTSEGFSSEPVSIAPCDLKIHIKNKLPGSAGLVILKDEPELRKQIFTSPQVSFDTYFTGKDLLNNQTFRDNFKIEALPIDLNIKASNISIVFTDLKGSTELYERTGDFKAYSLVQQHFDILKKIVDKNSGAVVKTIGDAIMASFSHNADALKACSQMVQAIEDMNRETSKEGNEVSIKVGLHEGNALAVNANERIDYFGQTVNIAARVQGLAAGGEIWITEDIYENQGCRDILEEQGYAITKQSAYLKGVSNPVMVYQCAR